MNDVKALLLAAGLGTRLRPLTNEWPKCLMPIGKKPLLEYWLEILWKLRIRNVLVNLHHLPKKVQEFLHRSQFREWVSSTVETELLGTAGTLNKNSSFFQNCTVLLVHADNWSQCNFSDFIDYHKCRRPKGTVMTMMTFNTEMPSSCGILECNEQRIVQALHEKVVNPPGKLANAAVYLLEPIVLEWITNNPFCTDFSTDVLPNFLGQIATWHNAEIHRDIGTPQTLLESQYDPKPLPLWPEEDAWHEAFLRNPVHEQIKNITNINYV